MVAHGQQRDLDLPKSVTPAAPVVAEPRAAQRDARVRPHLLVHRQLMNSGFAPPCYRLPRQIDNEELLWNSASRRLLEVLSFLAEVEVLPIFEMWNA
jgi:hypothetical protein